MQPATELRTDSAVQTDRSVDVCIANRWFYPTLVGPGERFRRYAPGLRKRGVNLRVYTVQRPGLDATELVNGVPVERVRVRRLGSWREAAFVYSRASELLRDGSAPDVFQVLTPSRWNVPLVGALRLRGVPTLLILTLLGRRHGSWFRRQIQRVYRRTVIEPYDRIVTSSEVMTRELVAWGVTREKIVTIPNGVNLERFRPADSPVEKIRLRRSLGMGPDDEVVLFVGSILPRKAVDVLLEAWHEVARKHPGARLVLVGRQHEDEAKYADFHRRIDQLVSQSPDPGRVLFTGQVANVEDYLRAADVFVFPSRREGMPNVVPEAMASGVPCLLTPFHGLPDEFGRAGTEYELVERRPESMAAAICQLLDRPGERARLANSGLSWVREKLDLEKSLDRFAELYRTLASNGRSRRT